MPPNTPMDPVRVPGCATIASAPSATKYPPEAATDPIETTTGRPVAWNRSTSRRIRSEATYEPPGLSTRNTAAATSSSRPAARKAAVRASEVMAGPRSGARPPRPSSTGPVPWMTAITLRRSDPRRKAFPPGFASCPPRWSTGAGSRDRDASRRWAVRW